MSPGTFYGITVGLSGLSAAQAAQTVTGNNIANAGTAGYTVESADIVQGPEGPGTTAASNGAIVSDYGGGAVVSTITRSRDQYLDAEFRGAQSLSSSSSALSTALGNVQNSFNEPSTSGINAALSSFFTSVDNLENSPSDLGVRSTVIDSGVAAAQVMQTVQSNLSINSQSVATNITSDMSQVNTLGQQIAALNVQIQDAQSVNSQPNTLLDQRDVLVDNLSKLVNVTTSTQPSGAMNIAIGSTDLVVGTSSNTVSLASMQSRGDLTSGELAGLSQAQTSIATYQANLDTVASTLITAVNTVQEGGMGLDGSTGVPFFTGTNASTIAVNPTLISNPSKLAAAAVVAPPATTPPPGDASNAVLLGNVANNTQAALGGQTIQGYFNSVITGLGSQTKAAQTASTDAAASTTQFSNERNTVEGVSTDNEMTNMMVYQRSYQASAQFLSTQDSMLNTLINTMFGG